MYRLTIGILIGLAVTILVVMVSPTPYSDSNKKTKRLIALVAITCIITAVTGSATVYVANESSLQYIDAYSAEKLAIESSLDSDILSEFERFGLVEQVAVANKELAEYQFRAARWYGFDVADAVLELEPIKL